jgi:hypothetical protein
MMATINDPARREAVRLDRQAFKYPTMTATTLPAKIVNTKTFLASSVTFQEYRQEAASDCRRASMVLKRKLSWLNRRAQRLVNASAFPKGYGRTAPLTVHMFPSSDKVGVYPPAS